MSNGKETSENSKKSQKKRNEEGETIIPEILEQTQDSRGLTNRSADSQEEPPIVKTATPANEGPKEVLPEMRNALVRESDLPAVAAGLVHEVKNPLAAIHLHLQLLEGYADEIDEDNLKSKIQGKVDFIKKEVLSLNQSMQDFIRFVRQDMTRQGGGEQAASVDINHLVGDIVSFLEPQALQQAIEIIFKPGEIREAPQVEQSFLKQIVMNLIINSIQAFEKSDIPLEERNIEVATGEDEQSIFVRVCDNGPGIPEETQNHIFEPFFSTKEKGSGLGLALVKRMIAVLGGHLELHSEPGKGTEFTVFLGGPRMLPKSTG